MKQLLNQEGVIHTLPLLIIIASVGVISFLLISSTLPLNGLFGVLNPKSSSEAAEPMPTPFPNCTPFGGVIPLGQSNPPAKPAPMNPIWCYPLVSEPTSRVIDQWGGWIDNFATGVQMGRLEDSDMDYRVFNTDTTNIKEGSFVHNSHWMVDMVDTSAFRLDGGVMLSPNKAFNFENGKLVVEADAAAGSDAVSGADVFYELDITPAATTGIDVDPLYGYGQFGLVGGLGCRLQSQTVSSGVSGGDVVCAMYDKSGRDAGGTCVAPNCTPGPGRVWEIQGVGTDRTSPNVFTEYPTQTIPGTSVIGNDVWRQCQQNDADLYCRDRFRMEVTKTSVTLFVNGYKWVDIPALYAVNPENGADNRIPDSWIQNGVHVYFTAWINGGQHFPIRWHWANIAVNPHNSDGSPRGLTTAPTFCIDQPKHTCGASSSTPTPSPTSTPLPTPSPSSVLPTPTPSSSSTPNPSACPKALLGDINCDGFINLFDYSILITNFGKQVPANTQGDLDGNGIVNLFDYSILVSNFGK